MALIRDIPRRSSHCSQGGEPFSPGMAYYSTLTDDTRGDFCVACWKAVPARTSWKGVVPSKQPVKSQNDAIERAVEQLRAVLSQDPDEAYGWVLYLLRKRKMALRDENLYELLATEEFFTVEKRPLAKVPLDRMRAFLHE